MGGVVLVGQWREDDDEMGWDVEALSGDTPSRN